MCIFTFCLTRIYKKLKIRTDNKTIKTLAYLRLHNVRFQTNYRTVIKAELSEIYEDYEMKQKRIRNASDWLWTKRLGSTIGLI